MFIFSLKRFVFIFSSQKLLCSFFCLLNNVLIIYLIHVLLYTSFYVFYFLAMTYLLYNTCSGT